MFEELTQLLLRFKDRKKASGQGISAASRSQKAKRKKTDSFWKLQKGAQPRRHRELSPVRPISDF